MLLGLRRDYARALKLYRTREWVCQLTGRSGLSYEEALVSEQRSRTLIAKVEDLYGAISALYVSYLPFTRPYERGWLVPSYIRFLEGSASSTMQTTWRTAVVCGLVQTFSLKDGFMHACSCTCAGIILMMAQIFHDGGHILIPWPFSCRHARQSSKECALQSMTSQCLWIVNTLP